MPKPGAKRVAKIACAAPGCRIRFEPKRSTAKYCSATCRQRARRGTKPPAKPKPEKAEPKSQAPKRSESEQTKTSAADNHELVVALRAELEAAGAIDSFEGQLAVELARRLVQPDSSASSLADKVRAARAAALEQAGAPATGGGEEPAAEEDDEVTRARSRREEARKAAGLT